MAERETFNLTVQGFDSLAAYSMLRWSKRTSHQALNLETAGSSPARSTHGPIVHGLGSGVSPPGTGFDSLWGHCGVEELVSRLAHDQEHAGSNPVPAIPVSFNGRTLPC